MKSAPTVFSVPSVFAVPARARSAAVGVLGALLLLPAAADAGTVAVAGAKASSTYPADEGGSYAADQVIDGKASTSWVEGEDGSGLGAWIELDLGGSKEVQALKLWAGMWYSPNFWSRANRPKQIDVEFSDGSKHTCELEDSQTAQLCTFPKKSTSTVKLSVKQVHSGSTWLDTGISEVQVIDTSPEKKAKVREVKASTVFAADADGTYETLNASDGIVDTMWCEGSKDGDGTGEWLEFVFDGTPTVSSLSVINGIGGSMSAWFKANRATGATLVFSDGSAHKIAVKNSFKLETITFPAKATSSVRITFDAVSKGKEFNDLCISEAYFSQ